jgi:HD-like signal output (HDOD) protein
MDCRAIDLHARLDTPLPDLAAWVSYFLTAPIPVLASTAEALEAMRLREDDVDANLIGEMIAGDPWMTLRVLSHAAANRSARMLTDTGTVTAAVVMMGIGPFFRAFGSLPTVEDRLQDLEGALEGMQDVLRRSHRAATFALAFSVHRMDKDAPLIHQAALLHDFAELLLWCHAPSLALAVRERQHREPSMRSAAAQRELLGIELAELQFALMRAWHLHDLLVKTADERHAQHPSIRTVALAVRVARHSSQSWENPALGDDFEESASLLNLSPAAARQLVLDIGA